MADSVIDIDSFTNGVIQTDVDGTKTWEGTGIFDVIMKAVNGNIKVEYDNGRIAGPDYAKVYLGSMQSALSTAMQFLLQEQQAEKQVDLLTEQKNLVIRQTKGFDDDAKQKLLKQALSTWSVAYSVAQDANSIPDSIKVNVIDSVMKDAYEALGITVTNDPIGEL